MSELKHSFSTMLAAKSFAAHCAKVQCEEHGGSVESHWATIIVNELDTITKQRDELLKCLETVNSHAVYRAGTFNNGETVAQYASRVLSTIKEQKDGK